MKMLTSKRGFTLLELLMVIIVVGILASLAIPQYQNFVERSRCTEAVNMIAAIKSAQALYELQEGETAGAIADLSDFISVVDTTNWAFTTTNATITATKQVIPNNNNTITWTMANRSWSGTHPNAPSN